MKTDAEGGAKHGEYEEKASPKRLGGHAGGGLSYAL